MAVNVKKYAASGARLVYYGVMDTDGYLVGSTATAPSAGDQTGSGMLQLEGVKNFPFKPAQNQKNTQTGDDGPIAQFFYDPTELPSSQPQFATADYTFDALIQSLVVDDVGDTSILAVQPAAPTYRDICLIVQRQAKSRASGSVGSSMWNGLIIPKCNIAALDSDGYQERADAAFSYDLITNSVDKYPWGTALTALANGTLGAPAFKFTSPWKRHLWRWTGNNTQTVFNLPNTPAGADGNAVVIFVAGVKKTYTSDYTVDVSAKTVTFGAAPASNAKIHAWYGYV